MKRALISDKNIVLNIIEIDAEKETDYINSLPTKYTLVPIGSALVQIGSSYDKSSKKFTAPAIDLKAIAKKDLKDSEKEAGDILEKIYSLTDNTDADIDAWILKRSKAKTELNK